MEIFIVFSKYFKKFSSSELYGRRLKKRIQTLTVYQKFNILKNCVVWNILNMLSYQRGENYLTNDGS